jgi:diaminopimelate decarboxylase/aspartate kinase
MKTLNEDTFPSTIGDTIDQSHRWLVLKFGGTSVSSLDRWQTIKDLIVERQRAGYRPVVVHSALAKVSNQLLDSLDCAVRGNYDETLASIVNAHYELARELKVDGEGLLEPFLESLRQMLAGVKLIREISPSVHVKVLSLGELMATTLGKAYLETQGLDVHWVDARDLLCSSDADGVSERTRYLSADCDFGPDPNLQQSFLDLGGIILTQGFIARNKKGEGVLLGRGGSDTSAAYLAAKLNAVGLEMWTDVPGIFSADPRLISGARLLSTLSYQEAQEIASTGGSVLHPRCIGPVRRYEIPLRVRCTSRPELPGTLVSKSAVGDAPRVKAISGSAGITLVSMETLGMWHEVGFLAKAFRCFSDVGLSVDLVSTSESNVTVTLTSGAHSDDAGTLEELQRRLEQLCRVKIIENVEIVSLVGQKIRGLLHEIGPALEVFEENRIHLVSQAASDLNLSFVVEKGQSHRLIQKLHAILVQPAPDDALLRETWDELLPEGPAVKEYQEPWWIRKRSELLEIAESNASVYVYDLQTLQAAIDRLCLLTSVSKVFYSVKANNHPEILKTVYRAGLNFECVSPGEISLLLELFPEMDRRRLIFTPNFAPRSEYEQALDQNIWLTLDNVHPLRHWQDSLSGKEVFLRLDTGRGRGHHRHVRTAGIYSKFGIPLTELTEARELADACGATVVGLHAHTGSGILRSENWRDIAHVLLLAAREFSDVRYLDLGGGLGVPEKPGQQALDVEALDEGLSEILALWPDCELWLEPGRYLVSEAGVLIAQVTQTKGKGEVRYVGVSTGMNSLIRPALYGAYHEIVNLSRWGAQAKHVVNIVGPICETGDRLGNDRLLPLCEEGDVLLVANAGAYGRVMSSFYNLREPAIEIAI